MYAYTVHCTVQIYQFYRVLQGPGKFLRLISHGLSNKAYNLNVYTQQSLHIITLILNKVYTPRHTG
jgi:hypothetical protein